MPQHVHWSCRRTTQIASFIVHLPTSPNPLSAVHDKGRLDMWSYLIISFKDIQSILIRHRSLVSPPCVWQLQWPQMYNPINPKEHRKHRKPKTQSSSDLLEVSGRFADTRRRFQEKLEQTMSSILKPGRRLAVHGSEHGQGESMRIDENQPDAKLGKTTESNRAKTRRMEMHNLPSNSWFHWFCHFYLRALQVHIRRSDKVVEAAANFELSDDSLLKRIVSQSAGLLEQTAVTASLIVAGAQSKWAKQDRNGGEKNQALFNPLQSLRNLHIFFRFWRIPRGVQWSLWPFLAMRCVAWKMDVVFLCSDDASLKTRLTNSLERSGEKLNIAFHSCAFRKGMNKQLPSRI